MDIETSAAIAGVGARVERLEYRIDALETAMRTEFSAVRTELRSEFRDGLAEVRRHAEILHETLRDIRLLAEGFANISANLDAVRRE